MVSRRPTYQSAGVHIAANDELVRRIQRNLIEESSQEALVQALLAGRSSG